MEKVKQILYKIIVDSIYIPVYFLYTRKFFKNYKVESIKKTIDILVDEHKSMSRFGDGEFRCIDMAGEDYQKSDEKMNFRLKQILNSDLSNLIVCLPQAFRDPSAMSAYKFYERTLGMFGKQWLSYCNVNKTYYNTSVSRPYIDIKNKSIAIYVFKRFKELLNNKNVLVVEGNKTNFGKGNDLLNTSKNIFTLECPAENAFDDYNQILKQTKKEIHEKNIDIVLAAIGPTATILSYDLAKNTSIQALDVGHLDVEYSWFLQGAKKRIPIPGKEMNEIGK